MENFANMLVKFYIYISLIDDKHIDLKGDLVNPPTDYEKLHHRTKKVNHVRIQPLIRNGGEYPNQINY